MGLLLAKAEGGTFAPLADARVINVDYFSVAVLKSIIAIENAVEEAFAHENRSFL